VISQNTGELGWGHLACMPASFTGQHKPIASAFQAGALSDSGFVKSTHKIALPNQQT
jgi:hypothetical protein